MICIKGGEVERLLNLAIVRGIKLWNISYLKSDAAVAVIGIEGFKNLKDLRRQTRCRIFIKEKKGLPFLLHKLWIRKGFFAGVLFFVMAIYISSMFIWVVDIKGLKSIPTRDFSGALREMRLARGIWKSELALDAKRRKLMRRFTAISWLGMEVKGTVLRVEVVEKIRPPASGYNEMIRADKDGLITRMVVISGRALVGEGDTVRRGDPLITGGPLQITRQGEKGAETIDVPDTWQPAKGIVEAVVWYQARVRVPMICFRYRLTGEKAHCFRLKLGARQFKLGKTAPPYKCYRWVKTSVPLISGRNRQSIVEIIHDKYLEARRELVRLSEEQAIWAGVSRARAHLAKQLSKSPTGMKENIIVGKKGNIILVTVIREKVEEIGRAW